MTLLLVLVALAGDWVQLNESALASLAQGKFTDAERLAKAAVEAGASDAERAAAYMNLGRGTERSDRCFIEEITKQTAKADYSFSSLVLAVVQSDPFQKRSPKPEAPARRSSP